MNYKKLLESYIPLVDFIADIIGPHCEVLLHDVINVQDSVIAIRNGYISGRYVGCPLTDLGLKLLENEAYLNNNARVNYRSRTDSGENLISSTYYIKDEAGVLIGMICVNILNNPSGQFTRSFTDPLLKTVLNNVAGINDQEEVIESLSTSLDNVVDEATRKLVTENNIPVERMSMEEKNVIVQKLRETGIFKIKGAITKVASALKTSESTIYRYLSIK